MLRSEMEWNGKAVTRGKQFHRGEVKVGACLGCKVIDRGE